MDLRDAFERDEFFIVYQPIFNLREMVPTGVEALLRWPIRRAASSSPTTSSRSSRRPA